MKQFEIGQLARILNARTSGENAGTFTNVSIDSRAIKPDQCFFAIKGQNHDGHNFVAEVLAKGAACAVVDKNFSNDVTGCLIRVDNTIAALGDFAKNYRRMLNCKVIAITGSAGKTSTRHIIHHVLSKKFKCHQAKKSFNNNIGLPLTLLELGPEHEVAIVELGTNSPGEISQLTKIAEPDIAVVTNAYPAHIEFFGSLEAIIKEKISIADGLRPGGILIVNGDIGGLGEHCRSRNLPFLTFGTSSNADTCVCDIELNGFSSKFTVDGIRMNLPLAGRGAIENASAAYAVCKELRITAVEFSAALKTLPNVSMRMEPEKIGRVLVINDCYNANPASMKNAIELLGRVEFSNSGRKIFICGPMMELGSFSQELHKELGSQAAQSGIDVLLATGPFAKIVADSARNSNARGIDIQSFENVNSLCDRLSDFIQPDDIVLVKGSRAAKLELAVERIRQLFANKQD